MDKVKTHHLGLVGLVGLRIGAAGFVNVGFNGAAGFGTAGFIGAEIFGSAGFIGVAGFGMETGVGKGLVGLGPPSQNGTEQYSQRVFGSTV
jgi:hypothetical protein